MMTRLLLLCALSAFGLAAQAPQAGAKGGCYILKTSKSGKTYKRYVSKDLCKKAK